MTQTQINWFDQALASATAGQTESEFVLSAHPDHRGLARHAYRDVVRHFAAMGAKENPNADVVQAFPGGRWK